MWCSGSFILTVTALLAACGNDGSDENNSTNNANGANNFMSQYEYPFCSDLRACFEGCGEDSACVDDCINSADPFTSELYVEEYGCIQDNCEDGSESCTSGMRAGCLQ